MRASRRIMLIVLVLRRLADMGLLLLMDGSGDMFLEGMRL
jgi:hypothetical protein